jgi:hypothetical protein
MSIYGCMFIKGILGSSTIWHRLQYACIYLLNLIIKWCGQYYFYLNDVDTEV